MYVRDVNANNDFPITFFVVSPSREYFAPLPLSFVVDRHAITGCFEHIAAACSALFRRYAAAVVLMSVQITPIPYCHHSRRPRYRRRSRCQACGVVVCRLVALVLSIPV